MTRRRRLLVVGVLVLLAAGLCAHYGATYDEAWPHPTGDQLAEDPDGWDGERVLLFGKVQELRDDGFVMTVEDDAGNVARTVAVRDTSVSVEPGGTVQVYGELSERGTVQQAESVVVVNENAGDQRYKLVVSVLGGLLAAGLFRRHWRLDWRRVRFVRRAGGGEDG